MAALIRPIGLFRGGLKVSTQLQMVKTFLLPRLTYGFPLYHAKKVRKKENERADRLMVDWTFGKRAFIHLGLRLLNLEPTHCMQARIRAKLQRDPTPEIVRELRTASYQER